MTPKVDRKVIKNTLSPKVLPMGAQRVAKGGQGSPKCTHGASKGLPRVPKDTQSAPKERPKGSQGTPRILEMPPRDVQRDPMDAQAPIIVIIWVQHGFKVPKRSPKS